MLSGHLGHRIQRQKLAVASFPSSESDTLVALALAIRLDTGGQSNVPEQLGHDKRNGSQPQYLSLLQRSILLYAKYSNKLVEMDM